MTPRDFSTVSPSAKSLLFLKAQTNLPFAKEAAELLWGGDPAEFAQQGTLLSTRTPEMLAARRLHFEMRARSVDEALTKVGIARVLEIAAGWSFRGLAWASKNDVHYLDTDLPGIIEHKADMVTKLHPAPLAGTLRIETLDALDAAAFRAAVDSLPEGPIAIVHEGLLMYLDPAEKARLAISVREALERRGGVWITADIYIRDETRYFRDERTRKFLEEHKVEENKFASLAAAESYFTEQGFGIDEKLVPPSDHTTRETWVLGLR